MRRISPFSAPKGEEVLAGMRPLHDLVLSGDSAHPSTHVGHHYSITMRCKRSVMSRKYSCAHIEEVYTPDRRAGSGEACQ